MLTGTVKVCFSKQLCPGDVFRVEHLSLVDILGEGSPDSFKLRLYAVVLSAQYLSSSKSQKQKELN